MVKTCFKCGAKKDLSEFPKHKQMADGHLGKCKECNRKDAIEYRNKNIERVRAYDRQRSKLPHRKKLMARITRDYRKKNPLRYAASTLLGNAIRNSKIKKPTKCSMCNRETKIVGHHTDYYKPLDVIWLCQACHKKIHLE